jgi:hypothetical protein
MQNEDQENVQNPPTHAEYMPHLQNTNQSILRTGIVDSAIASSELGVGARPKERISRPNSLLGLSTPDLPALTSPQPGIAMELPMVANAQPMIAVAQTPSLPLNPAVFLNVSARDSGIVADLGEVDSGTSSPNETANTRNIHDLINTQLAAQKSLPLKKKHLNLEIKQHLNEEQPLDNRYCADVIEQETVPQDTELSLAQRPAFLGTGMPSASQSAILISHGTVEPPMLPSGGEQLDQHSETTDHMVLPAGSSVSVLGSSPRLKRPSSLNIVPQSEDQISGDTTPTADFAMEASSPSGTLGTGEVAIAGGESPMDNMQDISLEPEIGM